MMEQFNRCDTKDQRRALRQTETVPEALLWDRLRDRQVGRKFRRQCSVGVYILGFYCPACRLAIELDGESHASAEAQEYHGKRTEFLSLTGIRVLRFATASVYQDRDQVVAAILTAAQS